MGEKLRKCIKCGVDVQSYSPMRKYCFDCRIAMRRTWAENTRVNKIE